MQKKFTQYLLIIYMTHKNDIRDKFHINKPTLYLVLFNCVKSIFRMSHSILQNCNDDPFLECSKNSNIRLNHMTDS